MGEKQKKDCGGRRDLEKPNDQASLPACWLAIRDSSYVSLLRTDLVSSFAELSPIQHFFASKCTLEPVHRQACLYIVPMITTKVYACR